MREGQCCHRSARRSCPSTQAAFVGPLDLSGRVAFWNTVHTEATAAGFLPTSPIASARNLARLNTHRNGIRNAAPTEGSMRRCSRIDRCLSAVLRPPA